MGEFDNSIGQDPAFRMIAEAKVGDLCTIADSIVAAIGTDRSTDERHLVDAGWTSYELGKRVEIQVYSYDDDSKSYHVLINDVYDESDTQTISFESDSESLRVTYDDGEEIEFDPRLHPNEWVDIESIVSAVIRTTPVVELTSLPIDESWHHLFHDMMVYLATEDTAVKAYIALVKQDKLADPDSVFERTIAPRLQREYALPAQRVAEVMLLGIHNKEDS